ncbi:hypothetical protein RGQ29_007462 [Quercus rubra]|uniref:Uncharacterized protein n=1 Tax=Quercus rubra TaxID=3512 RepID=A0AAN7DYH9_QUERU|nr:hypothetical protein RGQ29_007462 [Quercus rubra]
MATCRKEKAVLVTVYVERPRKKASTNHHHHHHHHHYLHHTTKREVTQVNHGASGPGKGYDRRAQLLQYSKRLRESSRSATITPLPLEPTSSSNHNQQPSTQLGKREKKKHRGSKSNTLKDVMKDLEGQKKQGFISKLSSTLQKNW